MPDYGEAHQLGPWIDLPTMDLHTGFRMNQDAVDCFFYPEL
jgi:hypothetical protein